MHAVHLYDRHSPLLHVRVDNLNKMRDDFNLLRSFFISTFSFTCACVHVSLCIDSWCWFSYFCPLLHTSESTNIVSGLFLVQHV